MPTLRILLTAGAAAFAVVAAANGFDRMSRNTPGLERLVPQSFRAQADRSSALTELVRERPLPALEDARAAVAHDPIDPDATSLLGAAYLMAGDFDAAAEAFRIAARFGWRNLATQRYWLEAALGAGDYKVAADRADAILRAHPRLAERAEVLRPLEENPAARAILAERLSLQPAWLEPYLKIASDAPAVVVDRRLAVLSLVDPARHRFGCEAVSRFVSALVELGRRSDAQQLWNDHCPERRVAGYLADPEFDEVLSEPGSAFPLSWQLVPSGNVSVQPIDGASGERSLLIANTASTMRLVLRQLTAFPPGSYRFRVSSPDKSQSDATRLQLSWACDGQPPFPRQAEGDPLAGGQLVHVTPCPRQQLGVWLRGNDPGLTISAITFEKIG